MTGHICPECGTDSRPDGGPGARPACACGQPTAEQHRTAERHRAERSAADKAEMAAAEDFDPLRIRPYVTLGNDTVPAADADERPEQRGSHRPAEDAAATMPLLLGPTTAGPPSPGTAGPAGPFDPADPLGAPGTTTLAQPVAPGEEPGPPQRRRPFVALAVGAALIAAVGTAAFASGLLGGGDNGDTGQQQALPGTAADIPGASVHATESAPASASPSPPPSASAAASPSTSASASGPPSASASPSPSAPTASSQPPSIAPSRSASGTPSAAPPASLAGTALRPGDQGPAVAELQRRLEEVWLYHGRDDGTYSDQVEHAVSVYQSYKSIEGDPSGVYGPNTRHALEAETTGRGPS
ncbi:peptidoglycan-binding domain-containing protein [Streptomyces sp. NPDC058240]|uniref:peptidoglycan-binding domain-containing protein n=1 Tax=Streptomyces sp. NPDC058240 TaxID=3346396 RepID=UPI0036E19348